MKVFPHLFIACYGDYLNAAQRSPLLPNTISSVWDENELLDEKIVMEELSCNAVGVSVLECNGQVIEV